MGESRKNIPNRLRRYRRIAGYKQCEVAELLGLRCTDRLSRWEQGQCMPSVANLIKLGVIYDTLVEELYYQLVMDSREEFRINYK